MKYFALKMPDLRWTEYPNNHLVKTKTGEKARVHLAVYAWEAAEVEWGDLDVVDVGGAAAPAGMGCILGSKVAERGLLGFVTGGTAYAHAYRGRARAGTSVVGNERTTYDESEGHKMRHNSWGALAS